MLSWCRRKAKLWKFEPSDLSALWCSSQCSCFFRLQEIQKDHPFPTPKDSAHHFTGWGLYLLHFLLKKKFTTWLHEMSAILFCMAHLCFICTSTAGTVLSDCPSSAICHTATKSSRMLLGRFTFRSCEATSVTILWFFYTSFFILEEISLIPCVTLR